MVTCLINNMAKAKNKLIKKNYILVLTNVNICDIIQLIKLHMT